MIQLSNKITAYHGWWRQEVTEDEEHCGVIDDLLQQTTAPIHYCNIDSAIDSSCKQSEDQPSFIVADTTYHVENMEPWFICQFWQYHTIDTIEGCTTSSKVKRNYETS